MNKLPHEFRLVITNEMGDDDWQLDQKLDIFKRELEARERAGGSTVNKGQITVFCPPEPQIGAFVYSYVGKDYLLADN